MMTTRVANHLWLCLVLVLGACTFDEQEPKVYLCSDDHPECPAGHTCNGTTCVKTGTTDGKPDMPLDGPVTDKGPDPDGVKPDLPPDGPVPDGPLDGPEVDKLIPDMPPVDFPWSPDQPVVDLQPPDVLPPADGACVPTTTRSCYTGAQGTNGVGECKSGTQTCTTGMAWGPCIGEVTPVGEICDGKDNDCDNIKDNGSGFICVMGVTEGCISACGSAGTRICTSSCTWAPCVPPAEVCNGVDDDCDGTPDNGFPCKKGVADFCTTSCGSTGSRTCNASCDWGTCTPPAETCNGVDDDCDGNPDNGLGCVMGSTKPCTTNCNSTGTQTCTTNCVWTLTCTPPGESCNGLDDDCDGTIDNGMSPIKTFYIDGDADTYGDPDPTKTIQACAAPPGYVSNSDDCYDANLNAKPGQKTYYGPHRGDGSWDYDCDQNEKKWSEQTNTLCSWSSTLGYCEQYADVWDGPPPACGGYEHVRICSRIPPNGSTCVSQQGDLTQQKCR